MTTTDLLPDLGVELSHLLLVNLRLAPPAALEHARSAFEQRTLPLMDHRRVNTEPACQFRHRLFALHRFQGELRLELRRMLLASRHL